MGKQCRDKTGSFATGAEARAALHRIRKRAPRAEWGKPLRVYPCPECKNWHVTTEDYEDNKRTKGYWE